MYRLACLLVALIVASAPAQARWRVAESENFRVYAEMSENQLRAVATNLEDYDQLLRLYTATPKLKPVKLDVVIASLSEVQRGTGNNIAGYYAATVTGVAAFAASLPGDRPTDTGVLFHEYTHHFLLQHSRLPFPRWFNEGLALYYESARFRPDAIEVGRPPDLAEMILYEKVPLGRVLTSRPGDKQPFGPAEYGVAWQVAHYIMRRPDLRKRIPDYLRRIGAGEAPAPAFEAGFGLPIDTLQRELDRYIRSPEFTYSILRRKSSAQPTAITIVELPPAANRLLVNHMKLLTETLPERLRAPHLRNARTAAAEDANPFNLEVLAWAETLAGDRAAADAAADRLAALEPGNAAAPFLKALGRLRESRDKQGAPRDALRKEARVLLGQANKLRPDDPVTLFHYATSFWDEPGFPTMNQLNALMRAHELRPQVEEYALLAGHAALERGEWQAAEAAVLPLTAAIHSSAISGEARRVLDAARARQSLPDEPEKAETAAEAKRD